MIVLADLGNSRLKWAVLQRNGELGGMRAATHDRVRVPALRAGVPVLAVSVAQESVRSRFESMVRKATGFAPHFVQSEAQYGALINGYRDAWRLGADRWVAMIGARGLFPKASSLLVVDIGTATTVDLVTRDGRHHGGLILPGPSMMVESLLGKTGGIAQRAKGHKLTARASFFARDTRSAVQQGAAQSVLATIEYARREARVMIGSNPKVILTGGGASEVAAHIKFAHSRVDDLVLRGLAQYAK
jgi:type III pantothenate kinase